MMAEAAGQAPPIRMEALFGRAGNGPEKTGFGWSAPENGFTWAIGDRSPLVLDAPPEAAHYVLDFDLIPFEAPPQVPSQRLVVSVNGVSVQRFDAVTCGRSPKICGLAILVRIPVEAVASVIVGNGGCQN